MIHDVDFVEEDMLVEMTSNMTYSCETNTINLGNSIFIFNQRLKTTAQFFIAA